MNEKSFTPIALETLTPYAKKYIWWQTPDEALARPARVIAQVMNLGDFEDMQAIAIELGDDALRAVLAQAEAGQFSGRSWAYWHSRLGIANVPPLPERRFS